MPWVAWHGGWGKPPYGLAAWWSCGAGDVVVALSVDFAAALRCQAVAVLAKPGPVGKALHRWPRSSVLAYLGRISYGVFLMNFPVALVVNAAFTRFAPAEVGIQTAGVLVAWLSCIAAGAVFHHVDRRSHCAVWHKDAPHIRLWRNDHPYIRCCEVLRLATLCQRPPHRMAVFCGEMMPIRHHSVCPHPAIARSLPRFAGVCMMSRLPEASFPTVPTAARSSVCCPPAASVGIGKVLSWIGVSWRWSAGPPAPAYRWPTLAASIGRSA